MFLFTLQTQEKQRVEGRQSNPPDFLFVTIFFTVPYSDYLPRKADNKTHLAELCLRPTARLLMPGAGVKERDCQPTCISAWISNPATERARGFVHEAC